MLSGIGFGSLARWVLTTGFNPACRVRASASAPSCRFQKVCAPWVTGEDGRQRMQEIAGSEFQLKADLVFLAMGFVGPRKDGLVENSGVDLDPRGNVKANTNDYRTSDPKIFACGDARRGQSLVVWAIREGRQCARAVDELLMGASRLPR